MNPKILLLSFLLASVMCNYIRVDNYAELSKAVSQLLFQANNRLNDPTPSYTYTPSTPTSPKKPQTSP